MREKGKNIFKHNHGEILRNIHSVIYADKKKIHILMIRKNNL